MPRGVAEPNAESDVHNGTDISTSAYVNYRGSHNRSVDRYILRLSLLRG
jgi:hypothetical protein